MKNLLSILILIFALNIANAQIGINTTDPDPNAVLHIFSLDKGILIPRMPSVNRNPENYPNPPNGVIVYDTTLKKFFVWRKHMGGIEKSGKWEYINPWTVNDTYHKMSLSTSVASEVDIEGELFVRGGIKVYNSDINIKSIHGIGGNLIVSDDITLLKLSAGKVIETDENKKLIAVSKKSAYNKSFGAGNSNVARGNHTHDEFNNNPNNLKKVYYTVSNYDCGTSSYYANFASIDIDKIVGIEIISEHQDGNRKHMINGNYSYVERNSTNPNNIDLIIQFDNGSGEDVTLHIIFTIKP